jgi:hypothetical protein
MFEAIWTVLKDRQAPDTTRLANTFLKMPVGEDHIWIMLYTIQPNGKVLGTSIDPTHADKEGITAEMITASLEIAPNARARFAFHSLDLGVHGLSFSGMLDEYAVVSLAAHDLAAGGRAENGADLLIAYLSSLPEVTKLDWAAALRTHREDVVNERGRFFPGAKALVEALETKLPAELR